MSFGEQLKAWREQARLTQTELAARAKISVPYLSNLERDFSANTRSGKPRASAAVCERLASALSVPVDDVLLAAGHAPKSPPSLAPPRTMEEFLALAKAWGWVEFMSLASRKPIDEFTEEDFAEFWERMQRHAANEVDWKLRDR